MITQDQWSIINRLLNSDSTSLKELAQLSGRDIFTFYNGASLVGLDLTGQDLIGLNFDKADLRSTKLDDIKFDAGAFNGSILDQEQNWLSDEFEFYLEDLRSFPKERMLIFIKIRPGIIDHVLKSAGVTFALFSTGANVSENALRKARKGSVVSIETALSVLNSLSSLSEEMARNGMPHFRDAMRQPLVQFVSGGEQRQLQWRISPTIN